MPAPALSPSPATSPRIRYHLRRIATLRARLASAPTPDAKLRLSVRIAAHEARIEDLRAHAR